MQVGEALAPAEIIAKLGLCVPALVDGNGVLALLEYHLLQGIDESILAKWHARNMCVELDLNMHVRALLAVQG